MLTFCLDSSARLSAMRPSALFLAALALVTGTAHVEAEPVQIKPSLLKLNGNLELPAGKKTADENVVLLVHGTLSHAHQETVAALQKNLKERGVASLAITLSLGIDDRQGPRDCNVLHDYALAGARREIRLWMEWLGAQHARSIDILGFSLGGAQVAAMGPELPTVRRIVLLAPAFATAAEQAAAYQRAFGHPLAPELEAAHESPLQKRTVDFLTCKQAPVLGATFLDAYAELPPKLATKTGHPTLVVVAGKDEIVPDLAAKLPSEVRPVSIDGASHFFADLHGEEAADVIAKFLKADQPTTK
jgi:pimeloyl-ACP methyl ester carboxylesterase